MRAPRLLSIGDLALDVVVRADAGIMPGTDAPGAIAFRRGGSAANTSAVFARLGGVATLVASVGRDRWAGALIAAVRADGVRVHPVRTTAPTARIVVLVGPRGERSFVTQRGAADRLRVSDLRPAWVTAADVLHLPAYSLLSEPLAKAGQRAATIAREAGVLVSVDLASHGPLLARGRRAAWATVAQARPDILFGNLEEASALTAADGLRRLLEIAPLAVIKEGGAGCRVMWRRAPRQSLVGGGDVLELTIATARVDALDTTGAGDAFDAGFLHSLMEQVPPGQRTKADGGRGAGGGGDGQWTVLARPGVLRRAALAGHRAAAQVITRPRPELAL